MATRRRGAYAASMLTLAVFLAPALLSPGRLELANAAGVALALWLANDAWRGYRRYDWGATLPYRVRPVAPGVLGAAALIFAIQILHAWTMWGGAPSGQLVAILAFCDRIWSFPLSPIRLLVIDIGGPAPLDDRSLNSTLLALSSAVGLGLLFGIFTLIGGIAERSTLRLHALIWKGARLSSAEENLASRGAKGLRPIRDPLANADRRPVSAKLLLRVLMLAFAALILPYAPFMMRWLSGLDHPKTQEIYGSPLFDLPFFTLWAAGLWAIMIAGAIIMIFAYLRLAFALRRR